MSTVVAMAACVVSVCAIVALVIAQRAFVTTVRALAAEERKARSDAAQAQRAETRAMVDRLLANQNPDAYQHVRAAEQTAIDRARRRRELNPSQYEAEEVVL